MYIIFKAIKNLRKKINYFPRRGGGGTPFAENSAKIINLIFEPFPNLVIVILNNNFECHCFPLTGLSQLEKNFNQYFNVSEHAIFLLRKKQKQFTRGEPPFRFSKRTNFSRFFFMKAVINFVRFLTLPRRG